MSRFYRRTEPGRKENVRAGAVAGVMAGAVAAVSFYVVRLFLAREPLDPKALKREPSVGGPGEADQDEAAR